MTSIYIFLAAGILQAAYWVALRIGVASARRDADAARDRHPLTPITVIVAARNEEGAMPSLLEALSHQRHRPESIIIVDDASTDATAEIVRDWSRTHPNVRLIQVTEPIPPRKKHALTTGIAAAPTDLLAFTDADCTPGPGWTEGLASAAGPDSRENTRQRMIISYSPFKSNSGALNLFSRFETFITGYMTAAAVGLGRPYMAVGRNMCYRKSLFEAVDGFEHSTASLSGDDDLLVQHVAREDAAEIVHLFDPAAYVPTSAPQTWRQFCRQKTRHTSAGRFYPAAIKAQLALFQATNVLLWISPVVIGWPGAVMLGVKLVLQGVFLSDAERLLNDRGYVRALPLLDFGYALYNLIIAPIGLLRMPRRW
jgi:cellulose synthase/poly-beta-1,6-N-acetylglucosamine synthase-like glycosyltransferase